MRAISWRWNLLFGDLLADLYAHLKGSGGEWKRLRTYAGGEPGFSHWLAVVASRLARGSYRPQPLAEPERDVATEPEDVISRVDVALALSRLKHPECGVLIRRRYWEGQTIESLATPLGKSAVALRQMLKRNLEELRPLMEECGG